VIDVPIQVLYICKSCLSILSTKSTKNKLHVSNAEKSMRGAIKVPGISICGGSVAATEGTASAGTAQLNEVR